METRRCCGSSSLSLCVCVCVCVCVRSMPGDEAQIVAADELAVRNWVFHKRLRMWMTPAPNAPPPVKTPRGERGNYLAFNPAGGSSMTHGLECKRACCTACSGDTIAMWSSGAQMKPTASGLLITATWSLTTSLVLHTNCLLCRGLTCLLCLVCRMCYTVWDYDPKQDFEVSYEELEVPPRLARAGPQQRPPQGPGGQPQPGPGQQPGQAAPGGAVAAGPGQQQGMAAVGPGAAVRA